MMDKFQPNLELTIIRMRGLLFLSFFFSVNKSTDETNTILCQQNVAEFSSHEHLQRTLLLSEILVSFKIFKNGHFIVKNLYKTGTCKEFLPLNTKSKFRVVNWTPTNPYWSETRKDRNVSSLTIAVPPKERARFSDKSWAVNELYSHHDGKTLV